MANVTWFCAVVSPLSSRGKSRHFYSVLGILGGAKAPTLYSIRHGDFRHLISEVLSRGSDIFFFDRKSLPQLISNEAFWLLHDG